MGETSLSSTRKRYWAGTQNMVWFIRSVGRFQQVYQSENKLMPRITLLFPTDNERQNYNDCNLKAFPSVS